MFDKTIKALYKELSNIYTEAYNAKIYSKEAENKIATAYNNINNVHQTIIKDDEIVINEINNIKKQIYNIIDNDKYNSDKLNEIYTHLAKAKNKTKNKNKINNKINDLSTTPVKSKDTNFVAKTKPKDHEAIKS